MAKRITEHTTDAKGNPVLITGKAPITKDKHRVGPVSLVKDIRSVLKKG